MPNFDSIVKSYIDLTHFAGDNSANKLDDQDKRTAFIAALLVRKKECSARFKIAFIIFVLAVLVLIYLSLYNPVALKTFKELMSVLGGGSILALLYYLISLRDELTKIKQTEIIAVAVDSVTLNTMLLTLSSK